MYDQVLETFIQNQVGENHMRLIILGIDALDISMVDKLDLRALKQLQYGELNVPLSSVSGYPHSPSVWATFLSGNEVEIEFTRGRVIDFIVKYMPKIRLIRRFLQTEFPNRFIGMEKEELFVDFEGVKGINVPFRNHEVKNLVELVRLRNKLSRQGTIRKFVRVHNSRTEEVFNEVINTSEVHKVIFAFIQSLDTLQHALFLRKSIVLEAYRHMERCFSYIKEKLSEDMIIIVSDHGFDIETGQHSYTGFYSCNHILNPKPTHITDFYGLVNKFLNGEEIT